MRGNKPIVAFRFDDPTSSLDSRITFSRASSATYFDSTGTLQTAGSGVARAHAYQDYNPSTLAPLGFLIEEQRTNLLTYSAEFDNAAWTKSAASVTANASTAPDGTSAADKLVEDATNAAHFIRQNITAVVSTTYADSVFLKAAERTAAVFILYDGATFWGASINLSNGAISTPPVDLGLSDISATTVVQTIRNGWYRVSIPKIQSTTTTHQVRIALQSGSNGVYTGNGTSGIYVWGGQAEAGAFATSYIATTTAAATRLADSASITGTNFSSWYNQSEGTVLLAADVSATTADSSSRVLLSIGDSSTFNESIYIERLSSSASSRLVVVDGGVAQAAITGGNITAGTPFKFAYAYKVNDFAVSLDGAAAGTDSSGTLPTANSIALAQGSWSGATASTCSHIRRISYYRTRLPNTTLQSITT